jgi:hypothetical protein
MSRKETYIELAKEGLTSGDIAARFCVEEPYVRACLRRAGVAMETPFQQKAKAMVRRCEEGASCEEIAKEFGLSGADYAYVRLKQLGAKPKRPAQKGNIFQIGTRKLARDVPRVVKMLGDLKRGMDSAGMQAKYGVCRERVSQVRAYGVEVGLLEKQT